MARLISQQWISKRRHVMSYVDDYESNYGPYAEVGLSEKNDVKNQVHYWSSADEQGWDGEAVEIVAELNDGRWVFIEGSCDYTGWDCQAGADAYYASSEAE